MSFKFNDLQLKEDDRTNLNYVILDCVLKNININFNLESHETENEFILFFTPEIEFEVLVGGRNESK